MPVVNGKRFPYTESGKRRAKALKVASRGKKAPSPLSPGTAQSQHIQKFKNWLKAAMEEREQARQAEKKKPKKKKVSKFRRGVSGGATPRKRYPVPDEREYPKNW